MSPKDFKAYKTSIKANKKIIALSKKTIKKKIKKKFI